MNEKKKEGDLHIKVRHTLKTVALSYVVENLGINIRVGEPIKQKDEYKVPIYLPLDNGEKVTCGVITVDKDLKIISAPDFQDVDVTLEEALRTRFLHALHTFCDNYGDIYVGTKGSKVVVVANTIYDIAFEEIMNFAKIYHYYVSEIESLNNFIRIHFTLINNIVEEE